MDKQRLTFHLLVLEEQLMEEKLISMTCGTTSKLKFLQLGSLSKRDKRQQNSLLTLARQIQWIRVNNFSLK